MKYSRIIKQIQGIKMNFNELQIISGNLYEFLRIAMNYYELI